MSLISASSRVSSTGFEKKQGIDYGPEVVLVSRDEAADYLARAREFLAAARRVCE